MTDELRNALLTADVDLNGSITRFSGNLALYERFLRKFVDDAVYQKVVKAFHEKDYEEASSSVHTLKGVSGNLGITHLYHACAETMDYLRAGDNDSASSSFPEIEKAYQEIIAIIQSERG